jgi:tetratricopeptide (TPR) repeat protein
MACVTGETRTDNFETICHLEDLTIVWLDITIDSNNIVWSKRQSLLRSCINYIRTFTDQNECLEYISTIHDERIFLIASGSLGEIIVPKIHNLSQISAIYIFCGDIVKHNQWSKLFSKIRGVFNDENSLMICLEKDAKIYSNTLIPISISHSNEYSLQDIDKEQVAFLWFQLMIEVIYRLPQTSISKKQMIDECRTHYADNSAQLSIIDEFYNKYNGDLAIEWYTKDSFLYRLLNKAFRTQNIDLVFYYHYFVSDLTRALTKLYLDQFNGKEGILTVYRGQHMHIDELERLKNSIGRLMSVNTFFSTTTSSEVAADFSGNGEYRSQGLESVIFQIKIDLSIQRRPFGKIDQLSSKKNENEILFAVGSVFRIENVELFLDNIWLIILTLTDGVKKEIEDLLAYFTKHVGTQPSLLELGVLLSQIGDFERAKRFYLHLKNELPENHYDLGVLYNNLGEIYRKQGYLDVAMEYYKLAIDELTESFGFLDPWFAIVHSNIAMIYDVRREFDQALIHYRCALHIIERDRDGGEGELYSTIYNGMAAIFQQKGQLETALKFYEKTLKIELAILPSGHPSIAITYNNIGQLYFQMNESSKAFENYRKALPIMLSTLPNNHPDLATLYANIGIIYICQNQSSQGIENLLEAEKIIDRSILTFDHKSREDIYLKLTIMSRADKMIDLSIRMHKKLIDLYKARTPPDQYEIALWTHNLGNLLYDQGNLEEAFNYQQISLNIIEQLPRTEKNKDLYSLIIDGFSHSNHFDVAIEHYTRLLNEETNIQSLFAGKLHNNLGVVYDYMENDLMALKHYTAALTCYDSRPDIFKNQMVIIHYNIAVILNNLTDYENARLSLYKSLKIANENDYKFLGKCHYLFGETYEKTNNWVCAREHFHEAIELATRANSHPQFIAKCTRHLQQVIIKIEENTSTNFEQIKKSNED